MRMRRNALRFGLIGGGILVALAAVSSLAVPSRSLARWWHERRPEHLTTSPVRRTDLSVSMTTGGRVDSSNRTVIECGAEAVSFGIRGQGISVGGASTILTVVPDGTPVKKGDVLCTLDSSAYEELVRQQAMNVERARADFRQAELNAEIARMAVVEYKDGIMAQSVKDLRGRIALYQSDVERATDRLAWTRRMFSKGYLPQSQVLNEELNLNRMGFSLKQNQTALNLFEKWSAPKYIHILHSDVLAAEAVLNYQTRRLQKFEERLDYYKRMVERCTIRAPHDGVAIHANEMMRQIHIEPGLVVRQRQRLFYLPDLSHMEVAAMLHESVVKDVKKGMRARVRIEALPDRVLEGYVDAVTQLPTQNFFNDVKYFVGTVKLNTIPRGLMPGMSAEVEIVKVHRPDALVVPTEALAMEGGHEVCYVASGETLERREVKLGQVTRDLLEVSDGLNEGEEVVIDPAHSGVAEVAVAAPAPAHAPSHAEEPEPAVASE